MERIHEFKQVGFVDRVIDVQIRCSHFFGVLLNVLEQIEAVYNAIKVEKPVIRSAPRAPTRKGPNGQTESADDH